MIKYGSARNIFYFIKVDSQKKKTLKIRVLLGAFQRVLVLRQFGREVSMIRIQGGGKQGASDEQLGEGTQCDS